MLEDMMALRRHVSWLAAFGILCCCITAAVIGWFVATGLNNAVDWMVVGINSFSLIVNAKTVRKNFQTAEYLDNFLNWVNSPYWTRLWR
jgi:hypothetical protein